jgi:hypothetical protein
VTFIASSHIFKHHFIIKATATFQKGTLSFSLQTVMTAHYLNYQHLTGKPQSQHSISEHNVQNWNCMFVAQVSRGQSFTLRLKLE